MTNLKTLLAITQTLMPRLKSSLNWLNFIMKNNKNIKFKNSSDISMNIQEVQKVQNPKMISTFISNTPTKRCQQLLPHNSLEKNQKDQKAVKKRADDIETYKVPGESSFTSVMHLNRPA